MNSKFVAILIPCLNEEETIFDVVSSFSGIIPNSKVFVYDNCSSDNSVTRAMEAGAIVKSCTPLGKGNVVSKMFREIDADVYVLVDGDGTYCSSSLRSLVDGIIVGGWDMVVASRLNRSLLGGDGGLSVSHYFGNKLITFLVNRLFLGQFSDVLSGYRAFNGSFAKSLVLQSKGFEVETEISIDSIVLGAKTFEIPTPYFKRHIKGTSKLRTFRDGFKIVSYLFQRYFHI